MYTIRESTVGEVLASADKLFSAHWDEIASNKPLMVIKPDAQRYQAMEAAGSLFLLAAFDTDNKMVGYSVNFIMNHLHFADLRTASNDLLFVEKAHRSSKVGLQLIRETEQIAKTKGAHLMLWHARPETTLAELMPHLGYSVQEIIFTKEI